jgi:2-(3-amino-3-carboxypropyl)histidine synthase
MEVVFVNAEMNIKIKKAVEKALPKLGKNIGLLTTAQHLRKVKDAITILEKNGKKVFLGTNKKTKNKAETLGCDFSAAEEIKDEVDTFLYIGTGMFHPIGIFSATKKKLIIANPITNEIKEITEKDIEKLEKRKKGALLKFMTSKNIGIIVTTKPGQNKLKQAIKLKEELKDKKCYILLTDTLDFNELENYPFIDCFVNTMCPRIGMDDTIRLQKPIINIEDIRHQTG